MRLPVLFLIPLFSGLLLALSSCNDGETGVQTQGPDNPVEPDSNQRPVLVVNEGTFNNGNASLGIYYPQKDTFRADVFEKETGRPLGDVFQSITIADQRIFLVINNSGKVEVLDSSTYANTGTIRGLPSPRYLQPLGDGRAYVTNFTQQGNSVINIVDLANLQITGEIATGGWTGNPAMAGGKAWVPEVKKGWLLALDPATNTVTDTLKLRPEIHTVVRDQSGNIWALANGGINNEYQPTLYRIDPEKPTVLQRLPFPGKTPSPGNLTLNGSRDTLYYTRDGIYRLAIEAEQLPGQAFVPAKGRSFYGLGIEPSTGTIYASDAFDFVRRGKVYLFGTKSGKPLGEFKAGIIPSAFVFP